MGKRRFFFDPLPFPPLPLYPGGGCIKGGGPPAPGYPTCCPGMAITGMFVSGPYMGGEYNDCEAGRRIGGACTARATCPLAYMLENGVIPDSRGDTGPCMKAC